MTSSSITARLRSLIDAKRASGVDLYYVSQIGSDLGISSAKIEETTGRKLADFIRADLGYPVASGSKTGNTAPFVYFTEHPPEPKKRVRFSKAFWDAFVSRSAEPRFLRLSDLAFGSADQMVREDAAFVEIEPEFQPSPQSDDAADVTSLRIQKWIEKHGFRAEQFAEDAAPRSVPAKTVGGETLLERLVASLTLEERASISLPLEVTNALAAVRIEERRKP